LSRRVGDFRARVALKHSAPSLLQVALELDMLVCAQHETYCPGCSFGSWMLGLCCFVLVQCAAQGTQPQHRRVAYIELLLASERCPHVCVCSSMLHSACREQSASHCWTLMCWNDARAWIWDLFYQFCSHLRVRPRRFDVSIRVTSGCQEEEIQDGHWKTAYNIIRSIGSHVPPIGSL
jgi:hypothetical protein